MSKYQELKNKFEYIRDNKISRLSSLSLATYEYPKLIEEILVHFKVLEDNFEQKNYEQKDETPNSR